jgi:spore coat protein CotH
MISLISARPACWLALLGLLALLAPGPSPAAGTAAELFDDTRIREIRIYFDDPNWFQTLQRAHSSDPADPYFPARIVCGDEEIPQIGVRFKGNSSFRRNGPKKPFKLDFNRYDREATFFGLTRLNLHNFDIQPDFMREKLFHDFSSRYVSAMRSAYVRLYINDSLWGLYLALEQPDKTMMQDRYGSDEDGNLYEGEEAMAAGRRPNLAWLGPDQSLYENVYRLKTNEPANDFSGLIRFLDILNNTPIEQLREPLETICDVRDWLYGMALNNLMVNLDSYIGVGAEYYLYQRDSDGRFIHVSWDANEAFGTTGDGTPRIPNSSTLQPFYLPGANPGPTPPGQPGGGASAAANARPLLQRLWAVPEYRRLYLRAFAQFLREGFSPEPMAERIEQLANLIRDDVYADPNKAFSAAQFETTLNSRITVSGLTVHGLNEFVRSRHDHLRTWLDQQAAAGDIRLNEIVPVNGGSVADDAGEHDPWLEIHNLGPGSWDLGRLYLTDDPATPDKWRLPSRTLADGGHLVLWLDGQPSQGELHAAFRLQAAGGRLLLFAQAAEGFELIDEVEYPALVDGSSFIRLGDMDRNWAASNRPTPGEANLESEAAVPAVFINEFLADNQTVLENPDAPGSFDDWVELYNAGAEDIDLGGMYLTDNLDRPTKWRIPEGVVIPARGYLLFWADDQTALGPLHAGFKLSKEGEEIGLFAADGKTVIDSLTFGPQETDVSTGRSPDGGPDWVPQSKPTPGAANGPGA